MLTSTCHTPAGDLPLKILGYVNMFNRGIPRVKNLMKGIRLSISMSKP